MFKKSKLFFKKFDYLHVNNAKYLHYYLIDYLCLLIKILIFFKEFFFSETLNASFYPYNPNEPQ